MNYVPILSVCIPTYNRRDRIVSLLRSILSIDGPIEVCIHVDGATDGTLEALTQIDDPRLIITHDRNQGRAGALYMAVQKARGVFTMCFDDDDDISLDVFRSALRRCEANLSSNVGGYIYNMSDALGERIGSPLPRGPSNYIRLRADDGVTGDKKEIVRTELIKQAFIDPAGAYRRVPSSLVWARIALTHDAICINESLGKKRYLADGMTSKILQIKLSNAYPMQLLQRAHCQAYFLRRYRSKRYFIRALCRLLFYSVLSLREFGRWRIR